MFNMLNRRMKIFEAIIESVKNEPGIDKKKAVAQCEINFGLSRKKAEEYIDTLITAEKIRMESGKLYPNE